MPPDSCGSSSTEIHHVVHAVDARTRTAAKGRETLRRHREERHAEKLTDMRAQTAAGTLVVRQMTPEQLKVASATAERTLARNAARAAARY
jgi:hypothetical protein